MNIPFLPHLFTDLTTSSYQSPKNLNFPPTFSVDALHCSPRSNRPWARAPMTSNPSPPATLKASFLSTLRLARRREVHGHHKAAEQDVLFAMTGPSCPRPQVFAAKKKVPQTPPAKTMANNDSRDAAIREAKLFVREVVRNDWEFNPSTASASDDARPTSSSACSTGTLYQNREVVEWRCREFDSSGSELEPQCSDQDSEDGSPTALKPVEDPAVERRRRRRRQMEEEMAWNEGLRMWMARRDAWSGARTRRQIREKEQKQKQAEPKSSDKEQSEANGVDSTDDSSAGNVPSTDSHDRDQSGETSAMTNKTDTSLSIAEKEKLEEAQRRQDQEEEQSTAPDEDKRKESTETSITEPDSHTSAKEQSTLTTFPAIEDSTDEDEAGEEEEEEEELDEPLIPVAPPFISSTNPIRATIGPSIYPSIYTKVVVQGMTPTVPVNLADLTKAMVQGWKADGQWPPKPAVSSIVLQDDATIPKTGTASEPPTQSRRKNSITNAMRKVFHLGSHPFHRRGSSSHDPGPAAGSI